MKKEKSEKKGISKTLVIIVVILALLIVGKNFVAKVAIEGGARFAAGLKLNVRSVDLNVLKTYVQLRNLTLFNPRNYPDKVMLRMPEIFVDYSLPDFFKGKVHLQEIRVNLEEFVVEKNQKGEVNINTLQPKGAKPAEKPAAKLEETKKGKTPKITIDKLELKVGKVIYRDYSGGGAPSVQEFNINLNEKYDNITNPYAIGNLIMAKALARTTIASLANIGVEDLTKVADEAVANSAELAAEASQKAQEGVAETAGKAQESVQKTASALADETKKLTDIASKIKLPFGKKDQSVTQ